MATLFAVQIPDRGAHWRWGSTVTYRVGVRVGVQYTRRVDQQDDGCFYVVPESAPVREWWPVWDDRGVRTEGWGVITRMFPPTRAHDWATCWVRMDR